MEIAKVAFKPDLMLLTTKLNGGIMQTYKLQGIADPMEAPPLKWGIIGPGGIARKFAEEVPKLTRSTIAAVASRSSERAASFAREFAIDKSYDSYEKIVEDSEIDAIYIATPHSEHYRNAMLAISRNKHILVEKSFTQNHQEAEQIFAAAHEAGTFVMEAMWMRFLPHFIAAEQLVHEGVIGDLVHLDAKHGLALSNVPRMAKAELGGGALLDLGIYPVTFAHSFLGVPSDLLATGVETQEGVDATLDILLNYGNVTANLSTTMMGRTYNNAEITGTKGSIRFTDMFYRPSASFSIEVDGNSKTIDTKTSGGFQYQAAEVARCIHSNKQWSARMDWNRTLETMKLMDDARTKSGMQIPTSLK